ncbi:hypothetical protein GALMADRAFT_132319 [Galerina marginata CBS 339.88]|uniref:Uncharacterized protein n=1 Tax=Galerina marginata (strain CBS 339.88) TaxID=685588 RepID=A0A067TTJ1_GALM3|nr:hypothetical protein GALMADRAFT_132319 [Galerina marginata CBS 339.88]
MTSKFTLMHASLAHLSPEFQAMNNVIHQLSHTTPTCETIVLPTEVLLLIREWLLPIITVQLIKQSIIALEAYEQSLCNLLCPDCFGYNLDIYGPDIWQWEQFSGACACVPPETDTEDPHGHRTTTDNGGRRHYHYISKATRTTILVNPKQFVDREHWLESHLSHQAASAFSLDVRFRGHSRLTQSAIPPPSVDIWDVVTLVLRDFQCEAACGQGDRLRVRNRVGMGHFYAKHDFLKVIPVRCHASPRMGKTSSHLGLEPTQEELDWHAQVILRRASRDLGLSLEYTVPQTFSTRTRHFPVPARRLPPSISSICYEGQGTLVMFHILLRVVASLAVTSVSLPITFTTVALTILGFYSRPKSFRIL